MVPILVPCDRLHARLTHASCVARYWRHKTDPSLAVLKRGVGCRDCPQGAARAIGEPEPAEPDIEEPETMSTPNPEPVPGAAPKPPATSPASARLCRFPGCMKPPRSPAGLRRVPCAFCEKHSAMSQGKRRRAMWAAFGQTGGGPEATALRAEDAAAAIEAIREVGQAKEAAEKERDEARGAAAVRAERLTIIRGALGVQANADILDAIERLRRERDAALAEIDRLTAERPAAAAAASPPLNTPNATNTLDTAGPPPSHYTLDLAHPETWPWEVVRAGYLAVVGAVTLDARDGGR